MLETASASLSAKASSLNLSSDVLAAPRKFWHTFSKMNYCSYTQNQGYPPGCDSSYYLPQQNYSYGEQQNYCCGGHKYKQVIHAPEPTPEYIVQRRRLPTPPPDIYEQTIVVKPRRQIIHEIIEQPGCPPPIVEKKYVMDNPAPPSYYKSTVASTPRKVYYSNESRDPYSYNNCISDGYITPNISSYNQRC
ncbi:hypothetical protein GJ496_012004 [Pomphorhynchus laevis]|nr:hypothetical protein GJ496_012004 [Pomphorhynchus laevis]